MRGKQERRVLEEEEKRQRRVEKTIRLCDGEVADSTSNTLTKGKRGRVRIYYVCTILRFGCQLDVRRFLG